MLNRKCCLNLCVVRVSVEVFAGSCSCADAQSTMGENSHGLFLVAVVSSNEDVSSVKVGPFFPRRCI